MKAILVIVFMAPMGIIMSLLVKDGYKWVKEWWRKRNINPIAADVERRRKEAGLENEHHGANWYIPFSEGD